MCFLSLSFSSIVQSYVRLNDLANVCIKIFKVIYGLSRVVYYRRRRRKNYFDFFFTLVCCVFFFCCFMCFHFNTQIELYFSFQWNYFPNSKAWANKFTIGFDEMRSFSREPIFHFQLVNNHLSRWWRRTWYDVHRLFSWVGRFSIQSVSSVNHVLLCRTKHVNAIR